MKRKTKSEPSKSSNEIRVALLDMSTQLLRAIEGLRQALAVKPSTQSTASKTPKPFIKRKGRPPMTEEHRAAAKAERERLTEIGLDKAAKDIMAEVTSSRAKPQPVTRASLAAQNAGRIIDQQGNAAERPIVVDLGFASYFTKAN